MSGEQVCPRCGRSFVCGMAAGEPRCWCAEKPALQRPPETGVGCLCPACLQQLLEQQAQSNQ